MLPVGLGFAAGAMLYVACFELFKEALHGISTAQAAAVTGAAVLFTIFVQHNFISAQFD